MDVARYGAGDYAGAIQALLPPGRALSPGDLNLQALLTAFAQPFVRIDAQAQQILTDLFPGTTLNFLSDWESSEGLTGQFDGQALTVDRRRALVLQRLVGAGVFRALDIVALGNFFGYDIGLIKYPAARAGTLRAGDRCYGTAWRSVIAIVAPLNTVVRARAGSLRAGEPLATWGNSALEAALTEAMSGHFYPIFIYVDGAPLVLRSGYCLVDGDYQPITA
jgi:uncharacterized protein YmfQ (DUF2313 family)